MIRLVLNAQNYCINCRDLMVPPNEKLMKGQMTYKLEQNIAHSLTIQLVCTCAMFCSNLFVFFAHCTMRNS